MTINRHLLLSHYFQSFLKFILLVSILSGCAYTEKLSTQLLPNSEFNALIVEGDAAMQDTDWAKASAKYEQAAQLRPRDLDVKMKQALAYQRAGKLARAHNMYQQVIDEGSQNGAKDSKIVKLAKVNQAKFGFKSAPKEPEIVAKNEEPMQPKPPVAEADIVTKDEPAPVLEPAKIEVSEPTQAIVAQDTTPEVQASIDKVEPVATTAEPLPDSAVATITQKISNWASDWQNKRLDAYYAHYASDFVGDAANVKAWRKERKTKILSAKNISVSVEGLEVKLIDADNANVRFIQRYQSAGYQDKGEKSMQLKRVSGAWLITAEQFAR